MQAMILEKPAPIENLPLKLRQMDKPQVPPGHVRIKVSCCAICRTDLHIIEGELPQQKLPIIPGHQVVGVVDMLGEGCSRIKKGQRVGIAWLQHTDGTCKWCRRSQENLCPSSRYTGYHVDGGYAQYALVPEGFTYEIPDVFNDIEASPLLCAGIIGYRALKRANIPDGGKLLLIGFGSSAHIVMQLAQDRGYTTYVVTRSQDHQRLAITMGAVWVGDDLSRVPEKVDSAISFAPVGKVVPPALEKLEKGGTLALAGIYMTDIPSLNYQGHLYYERNIHPVTANTRSDGRELLTEAAKIPVKTHTHSYALADANRALKDMKDGKIAGTGVLVMED